MSNGRTAKGVKGVRSATRASEQQVPLQVQVPKRVKKELDVMAATAGETRRTLVLRALKSLGLRVTDEDIAGRRGERKR